MIKNDVNKSKSQLLKEKRYEKAIKNFATKNVEIKVVNPISTFSRFSVLTQAIKVKNYSDLEYFSAIAADDLDTVKQILNEGLFKTTTIMSENISDIIEYSHYYHRQSYDDIVIKYHKRVSAIHVACRFGSISVLKYFLSSGIKIYNENCSFKKQLIFIATCAGYLDIILLIINFYPFKENEEYQLLKIATRLGYTDIIKFFIEIRKVNIDIESNEDEEYISLLYHVSEPDKIDIFNLLLDAGADVNKMIFTSSLSTDIVISPLCGCITKNNIYAIKQMIRCGLDVNLPCWHLDNGIFYCIYNCRVKILELLLGNCNLRFDLNEKKNKKKILTLISQIWIGFEEMEHKINESLEQKVLIKMNRHNKIKKLVHVLLKYGFEL